MPRTLPTPAAPKVQLKVMPPPPPPPGAAGSTEARPPGGPPPRPSRRQDDPPVSPGARTQSPRKPSKPKRASLRSQCIHWLDGLVGRVRDAAEALGRTRGAKRVHDFADLMALAREPSQVEAALVALAGEIADAYRVELTLDRDEAAQSDPKQVAVWPEGAKEPTSAEIEALGYPLCLGLWCGDHYQMTLQVYAKPGRGGRWPGRVVRGLTTLCAMAAAAERGLHAGRRARVETVYGASAAIRDATFLNAILPYALSQAGRHRESLTVFCVEVVGLAAVRDTRGAAVAGEAVGRVAEGIARTLRGSDVVARLDDDRLVIVLPNTGAVDALKVAGVVRSAATGCCRQAIERAPGLSASVGAACFPGDAAEMAGLLAAADEAVARARALGPDQVALFSPTVLAAVADDRTMTEGR